MLPIQPPVDADHKFGMEKHGQSNLRMIMLCPTIIFSSNSRTAESEAEKEAASHHQRHRGTHHGGTHHSLMQHFMDSVYEVMWAGPSPCQLSTVIMDDQASSTPLPIYDFGSE